MLVKQGYFVEIGSHLIVYNRCAICNLETTKKRFFALFELLKNVKMLKFILTN